MCLKLLHTSDPLGSACETGAAVCEIDLWLTSVASVSGFSTLQTFQGTILRVGLQCMRFLILNL